jgi:hypothetical protein
VSTFKTQYACTAELEGKVYSGALASGDWTQAYLCAVNTMPQYMREYDSMLPKFDELGNRLILCIARALYGGKGSAGLWDSCCDTWHTNFGFVRSLGGPRLYILTRGTARITMALATNDTAICVPHDKYHPGSQELYEVYVAALRTARLQAPRRHRRLRS